MTRGILASLLLCSFAAAADHTVGAGKDFATIQLAYSDAGTASGDTITVDAGTYAENGTGGLLLLDAAKNITIRSATSVAADVIIQAASATTSAISHTNGNVTLEYVTIDGTNLTNGNNGAFHSNASADNVTFTGVVWQNVGTSSQPFMSVTGTNGTVTFTGCTVTGGQIGIRVLAATTALVIDSTSVTVSGSYEGVAIGTGGVTTLTIRNNSSIVTAGTDALGISVAVTTANISDTTLTSTGRDGLRVSSATVTTMTLTDCTITGDNAANADGIHIDTGDTVTTLNISGCTVTCLGASGTCGALEIGGTVTALNISNDCTFAGGTGGVGLLGYDGTNFGTGTWIKVRDSTITSSALTALYLPKNFGQVDIENCTISAGAGTANACRLGMETEVAGAENDAPMGILRFVGNTVSKTGTDGHCMLFGSGCGRGIICGNFFSGGDYGVVFKWDNLEICHNKVYHTGASAAFYLAGAQYCKAHHNSVYTTGAHACSINQNQLTDVGKENVVINNIFVTTHATSKAMFCGGAGAAADADDNQIDYNCYYAPNNATTRFAIHNTAYATLALYKAGWAAKYSAELFSLNDANSVYGGPLFVDPANGDFSVPGNSAAMAAGSPQYSTMGAWVPNPRRKYGTSGATGAHGPE